MKKQAVINVADTENIVTLAEYLFENDWEIFTAGKATALLSNNGITAHIEESLNTNENVDTYTSLLIKIANSRINNDADDISINKQFLLVCVNLNPDFKHLKNTREIVSYMSNIDDRNATLVQVAAKNYRNVVVLTDKNDYNEVIVRLRTDSLTDGYRLMLAAKAFEMLAAYNGAIANSVLYQAGDVYFPKFLSLPYVKISTLANGMNEHQYAAFYSISNAIGAASGFKKLHWKDITCGTTANINAAWKSVFCFSKFLKNPHAVGSKTFDGALYTTQFTPAAGSVFTVAVIYGAAVGAALGSSACDSLRKTFSRANVNYKKATVGCSSVIDEEAARVIMQTNVATVVAPSYTPEAYAVLEENPNIHVCTASHAMLYDFEFISIDGGLIVQSEDDVLFKSWNIVTHIRPTQNQADSMAFGMLAAMSAKYEVAALITNMTVVAICCNGLDMLDFKNIPSAENDGDRKYILVCNSILPFTASVRNAVEQNVAAIIQTGGTEDDEAFIEFCNERNVAMVFTGITHISI